MAKQGSEPAIDFSDFLSFFPEVDLPIILEEELARTCSANNKVMPLEVIRAFLPIDTEQFDELDEVVPCFRVPETHDFHAIVYWEAKLMQYTFQIATYDKAGKLINHRPLAGTVAQDGKLIRTLARIEEDWLIHVVTGITGTENSDIYFDMDESHMETLELLSDGKVIIL